MCMAYRYGIGRHSYVVSMAGQIAQHYYDRLEDESLESAANDIRREIYDELQFLPFKFKIHRMYDTDILNPIDVLLSSFNKLNIDSIKKLFEISKIEYSVHTDKLDVEEKKASISSYFSPFDIEDLIPWADLASCFNKKHHKMITVEYKGKTETYRCFKSWRKKCILCDDKPGYFRAAEFGWDPVWVSVDNYLKSGNTNTYMNNDFIKEINEVQ